jgi:glycosyltransferase involved in cell wall biosynthesis
MPLVSVLMPVFNVEKYVFDAINSILKQSYINFELIVVDDGSQDDTLNIVKAFEMQDARVKVLTNRKNENIVYSLNKAFEYSCGAFILRMDGDDLCEPHRLSVLMDHLDRMKDVQLVGSSISVIDKNGENLGRSSYYSSEKILMSTIKYRTPVSHIWLAKREVYSELGGYRDIPGAEDYDFLLRMLTSGFRFTNLENDFSYSVRVGRDGNTSDMIGLKQYLLKRYVYSLYAQRVNLGMDDYSLKSMASAINRPSWLYNLHSKSQSFVSIAHKKRSQKKYFGAILMMVMSCMSPYQTLYLFERVAYLLVVFRRVKPK